jgi:hypothetical protein
LAYLPLQTSSNNTWLISLYKQVQTTLGLSPFTNKIKQHLDCLPSPNQVKATLTIKYQTIYKLPMGDETFMFPMNSRHHKTEYGYIVVFTGTFGRVVLSRHKENKDYFALKMMRITEVIRLKQIEHVKNEKEILAQISHPFIVNM